MIAPSPLDHLLKRDRYIVCAGLCGLIILASAYTIFAVGMKIPAVKMAAGPTAIWMPVVWSFSLGVLVFLMWWIMMIAMMVPSAAPVILLFSALKRRRAGLRHPVALTATFSLAATALQGTLAQWRIMSSAMALEAPLLGGAVLMAAGLYQFSAMKYACLRQCQSPIRFIAARHRPGFPGAWRMGLTHGAYCLGCCWGLMLLLFVGGVMNLYWIAGLAVYVLGEKLLPGGHRLARLTGLALSITGAAWLTFELI